MTVNDDAKAVQGDLVQLRRELHQVPELGLQLPRTQEMVLSALEGLPLEITLGKTSTSITAVLRGNAPGPAVLLRGDMDALPVMEKTGLDFAAAAPRMHACGHDLHTAMLVGAARVLAGNRDKLVGDVVFMFQPGEEGFDGASHMIAEGVLDAAGQRVIAAYGLHVTSGGVPHGTFFSKPGPFMAASDTAKVVVHGAGGHGSSPWRANDPIPAAAEMVTALQTLVTRKFDVFDPVVVTVGTFHAGIADNVIPDEACFEATVRSLSKENRVAIKNGITELVHGIAKAHGLTATVEFTDPYPVTVNTPAETEFLARNVAELYGEERFLPAPVPFLGSEDFSRVLDEVPGAFAMLGACPPEADPSARPFNHSPLANFDDSVLSDGSGLLATLAIERLVAASRT